VEIARGSRLDVIEIDGASNTSVNDVRQIKEEVLFPPASSRYKVYIIDEVHMLSNSAFNALLKTIEEPPPYVVFIFATTELHKVPATIKSRCQQFVFRLIPIETIAAILGTVCAETGLEAEEEALFWIAKESTGSLRDAYTLFDQVASFSDGHLRAALIKEKLGLVGLDNLNLLAETCIIKGNCGEALSLVDGAIQGGVAIEQFVIDLAGYFRSLLLAKAGIAKESLLGYKPERFSAKVLEALDAPRLEHGLELLLGLYRDIRYSVSPRFELETVIAKLCLLTRWISPEELSSAVAAAREVLGGAGANPPTGGDRGFASGVLQSKTPRVDPGGVAGGLSPAEGGSGGPQGRSVGGDFPPHESPKEPAPSGGEPSIDLTAPGGLREEFKRLMANQNRGGSEVADSAGPMDPVDVVKTVFNGTIVEKGE
jgi:DNA polymerase-3 subunit gamma/tau